MIDSHTHPAQTWSWHGTEFIVSIAGCCENHHTRVEVCSCYTFQVIKIQKMHNMVPFLVSCQICLLICLNSAGDLTSSEVQRYWCASSGTNNVGLFQCKRWLTITVWILQQTLVSYVSSYWQPALFSCCLYVDSSMNTHPHALHAGQS